MLRSAQIPDWGPVISWVSRQRRIVRMKQLRNALSDAFVFSKETFLGSWSRWPLLILLCLPAELFFLSHTGNDVEQQILSGASHFPEHAGLLILWMVLEILSLVFINGYLARIYRGSDHPPGFEDPAGILRKGLGIWVIDIIWLLPTFLCLLASFAVYYRSGLPAYYLAGMTANSGIVSRDLVVLCLMLLILTAMFFILAMLFHVIGSIRYARSGSLSEGLNFREIHNDIRRMGWPNYLLAFPIIIAINVAVALGAFISSIVTGLAVYLVTRRMDVAITCARFIILAIYVIALPVLLVFWARFIMRVYETNTWIMDRSEI